MFHIQAVVWFAFPLLHGFQLLHGLHKIFRMLAGLILQLLYGLYTPQLLQWLLLQLLYGLYCSCCSGLYCSCCIVYYTAAALWIKLLLLFGSY